MPEFTTHRPGTVCYVELATNNTDIANKFYSDLFGWAIQNEDMGEMGIYSQFLLNDKITSAMYKLMPEQESQGVPPHWATYFAVEDCEATTNLAVDIGGTLVAGPMNVADFGRLSVISDPAGATFCIWQTISKHGVELRDENNTVCWSELMTTDAPGAKEFYGRLFQWQAKDMDMGEAGIYSMLGGSDELPTAGLMTIDKKMGPIPPHWSNYFQIDDCLAAEKKALGMGAKCIVPTSPIPGKGVFCMLADPTGAVFGLYQSTDG